MKKSMIILSILIILISGCTAPSNKNITQVKIDNQIYTFSTDIREANNVHANDPARIKETFYQAHEIIFVSNESSQDSRYFAVIAHNIKSKLETFFAYKGKLLKFSAADINNLSLVKKIGSPILLFKGPHTGATQTGIQLKDGLILLQGTSYKNLKLAGDKLVLLIMDVKL